MRSLGICVYIGPANACTDLRSALTCHIIVIVPGIEFDHGLSPFRTALCIQFLGTSTCTRDGSTSMCCPFDMAGGSACSYRPEIELPQDVACSNQECAVDTVFVVNVAGGLGPCSMF